MPGTSEFLLAVEKVNLPAAAFVVNDITAGLDIKLVPVVIPGPRFHLSIINQWVLSVQVLLIKFEKWLFLEYSFFFTKG